MLSFTSLFSQAESFQVDEENQANTLVSVAPLPQEPLDKPTVNGESPPENGTNATPTTNGQSATQNPVADTEMWIVTPSTSSLANHSPGPASPTASVCKQWDKFNNLSQPRAFPNDDSNNNEVPADNVMTTVTAPAMWKVWECLPLPISRGAAHADWLGFVFQLHYSWNGLCRVVKWCHTSNSVASWQKSRKCFIISSGNCDAVKRWSQAAEWWPVFMLFGSAVKKKDWYCSISHLS